MKDQYELFLSEYFFYRNVLGKIVKDPRRLFDRLGEIFLTDAAHNDALFALAEDRSVADIKSYADYLRFCRIKKYAALMGDGDISAGEEDLIAVKGEALRRAHELKLGGASLTESAVFRNVTAMAELGAVAAMRVLGFMLCEGIYVGRDEKAGMRNIIKAARWNSVEGILLALYYGADDRAVNIERLFTVVDGTVYRALAAQAELRYGVKASGPIKESALLRKAFAQGKLKPEMYAAPYARIIFSAALTYRDKERAVFSDSEHAVSNIADLPLKLKSGCFPPDPSAISRIPLLRQKERERISLCLANVDLLTRAAYRPLCVCADSEYVRRLYAKHIAAAFGGAHIEYIDIAGLDGYDLQPTGKNIFVRSCEEDAFNVYFMSFTGVIESSVMQEAVGFLQSGKRKKFCLLDPVVALDLGAVLPICLCDKTNAKELKTLCDVVTVGAIADDEKPALFADMAASKQRLYGAASVTIADEALPRLAEMSVDGAERAIDAVVRFNRRRAETVITPALMDECAATRADKNRYGFGGDCDEI